MTFYLSQSRYVHLVAEKQQAAASIEADKAAAASAEAAAIEKDAEKELAQAEPAMLAAAEAVNCLSKAMLTELKSLPKPPSGVDKVFAAKLSGVLICTCSICRKNIFIGSTIVYREHTDGTSSPSRCSDSLDPPSTR